MKNVAWRLALSVLVMTVSGPVGALPQPADPVVLDTVEVSGAESEQAVVVSLRGNGQLTGTLHEVGGEPFRVFVDLEGVVPDVSPVTPVGRGHVERIRVALNQAVPPVTRVVVDMSSPQPYRLEVGDRSTGLRIVVGTVQAQTDRPSPERAYADWFERASKQADTLLAQPLGATGWSDLEGEIARRMPPPAYGVAHDLLKTVVRLGKVADRATATTGARLLLERARMLVDSESDLPTSSSDRSESVER